MKKETKLWFELAEEDFRNMKIMTKSKSFRAAVFFAQQSVEKILKAYIVEFQNNNPKKTHRVELLLKDAKIIEEEIIKLPVKELSKAYIWVRYPDLSRRFYTKKEITEMLLVTAKTVYIWVKNKFKNN